MSSNDGRKMVPSASSAKSEPHKILTGNLNNFYLYNYLINLFKGAVETISANDSDFDSLRLAFGRPVKKPKASLPKKLSGDPADVNGYKGPWGSDIKIATGPSEVNIF